MILTILLLFVVTATITAAPHCPYPNALLCGSDGKTYNNWCELILSTMLDHNIKRVPCKQPSYTELYRELLPMNEVDNLRSRNRKKKKMQHKMSNDDIEESLDFYKRLASIPFDFRRDVENDQDDEDED